MGTRRRLAAKQGRSLPVVIGELLDAASVEQVRDTPQVIGAYKPPPLLRLWIRWHPDAVQDRD